MFTKILHFAKGRAYKAVSAIKSKSDFKTSLPSNCGDIIFISSLTVLI